MMHTRKTNLPTTALTACILGIVACPFLYIAIGATFSFSIAFSLIMLPPMLMGNGFLLWRFLSKPPGLTMKIPLLIGEGLSWVSILLFLFFISDFTLQTERERIGFFLTLYLAASVGCFPLALLRETSVERRIAGLPPLTTIGLLLGILLPSALLVIPYLLSAPRFV